MMNILDNLSAMPHFLDSYGLWMLFVFVVVKFVTGVAVAVQTSEFKWFYVGEFLRNDGVKFTVVAVAALLLDPAIGVMLGSVFSADLWGGISKNIAHLFPSFAEKMPTSVRQPARLRLGNNKNIK